MTTEQYTQEYQTVLRALAQAAQKVADDAQGLADGIEAQRLLGLRINSWPLVLSKACHHEDHNLCEWNFGAGDRCLCWHHEGA